MKANRGTLFTRGALIICTSVLCAANGNTQSPPGRMAVWDTVSPSAERRLSEDLAEKDTWQQISRDQRDPSFRGDAVMANDRILTVLRKREPVVNVYSILSGKPIWRVQLRLQTPAGEPAARLERVALVENTRAAARLEAVYQTTKGDSIAARFRLKRGGIALEAEPGRGAGRLRVSSPGQYVVLPDFFADDILIDATKIPVLSLEAPSENFLLHMTGEGNAIVMCVFENNDQDVQLTLSQEGGRRIVTGSEIPFGDKKKIWVALMEAPQIWHALDVRTEDAGRTMPLDWKMPFAAQWRVDFTRANDLTDSWEMLYPAKDGNGYVKPSWLPGESGTNEPTRTRSGKIDVDAYKPGYPVSNLLKADRKRWTTVLGHFEYPCWTDEQGRGYLEPLKHKKMMFRGPAVLYPINRLPETPIETYTTVDVMRGTLGVGPCEYILNVEGQREKHVGRATCHARRLLNEIYENKQQKAKRKEIENYLGDALDFVTHIRSRINAYVEFGHEIRQYLAEQKKTHPELEKPLTEMEQIAAELDERMEARREKIKSPEFVAGLNRDFRKNLIEYEGPDALKRLKAYTDALTHIGGNQDELVGECRWIVRALRQRAALAMAVDPRFAEIAREIRDRTQKVLLKPAAYEGVRH